jgi:hypothetical protein
LPIVAVRGGWPRSSTAAARDLVRPEPCDWATDPRGRRIGPVFALQGFCDAPFSTMDLEYFYGLSGNACPEGLAFQQTPDAASEHRDPRVAELDAQIFKDDKLAARFKKVHPGETADPA